MFDDTKQIAQHAGRRITYNQLVWAAKHSIALQNTTISAWELIEHYERQWWVAEVGPDCYIVTTDFACALRDESVH